MAKKLGNNQPIGEQKQTVSKSHAVREYMKAHPQAKPSEIVVALWQQGIEISRAYVSIIRGNSKKRRRARRRAVNEVVEKRGVGIPEIKAALGLIKVCGGLAEAKEALAAAEQIRKVM